MGPGPVPVGRMCLRIYPLTLTSGQAPPANGVASSRSYSPGEADSGPWKNRKARSQGQARPGWPLSVTPDIITNPSHSTALNSRPSRPASPPRISQARAEQRSLPHGPQPLGCPTWPCPLQVCSHTSNQFSDASWRARGGRGALQFNASLTLSAQLTDLRKPFYLLDDQFITKDTKGYELSPRGKDEWGGGRTGKGCRVPTLSHATLSTSSCSPTQKLLEPIVSGSNGGCVTEATDYIIW